MIGNDQELNAAIERIRHLQSAPGSAMRTGPIGTPRTWWPSRPGSSCRHEPAAHGAGARRFLVAPQEHPLSLASPQGHLSWSTIRSAPALR
jgi:hypothetical protein